MPNKPKRFKTVKFDPNGKCPICRVPFKNCQHDEDYVRKVVLSANEGRLIEFLAVDLQETYPIPKIGKKYHA